MYWTDVQAAMSGAKRKSTSPGVAETLFADFNYGKLAIASALGAAVGAAYSVFDQTMLHRKQPGQSLPAASDYLSKAAPDMLRALDRFYKYRNTVPNQAAKDEFRLCMIELMRQAEYVAALYNEFHAMGDHVTPDMRSMKLFYQMKDHTRVAVASMRAMLALIELSGDVDLELAFNKVYECFNNRMFNIYSKFR